MAAPRGAETWSADLFPLPAVVAGGFRFSAVLVMAGPEPLLMEVLPGPAEAPEEAARELARAVLLLEERLGWLPARVAVRDLGWAAPLGLALAGRGVRVACEVPPPEMERMVALMLAELAGDNDGDPPPLWEPPAALAPAGPEGPGAAPAAALGREEDEANPEREDWVARFRGALDASGLGARTAARHEAVASLWMDFLEWQGVPLAAVTELDLRVFLYDWAWRKVWMPEGWMAGVPASLGRWFRWVEEALEIRLPWAAALLRDRERFLARGDSFPGGHWWDDGVGEWRAELYAELDARVMLHDPGLGRAARWGSTMGLEEAALEAELGRLWLLWRDEEVRAGRTDPEEVRAALVRRQRAWETSPHPARGGRTPEQVVRAERRGAAGASAVRPAGAGRTPPKKRRKGKPRGRRR